MKNTNKYRFFILLFFVIFVGCVHIELPHHGEVKDAETGEPLEGVLVSMSIYTRCIWPLPHIGSDYRGRIESITNKNGRYWLPIDFTFSLPMCFAESKNYTFFKPNYFEVEFTKYSLLWGILGGWSLGEFDEKYDSGHISLYKMKHHLNFVPYKQPHKYNFPSYHIEDDSKYYKTYVESINKLNFNPADEYGVFLRLHGKKLTRIYSKVKANRPSGSHLESIIYYIYDEAAKEWLVVDGRGNVLEQKPSKLPEWNFISSHETWGWPIYADKNKIFYPEEENPRPAGMKYSKGEIKFIDSHKGNILALAGTLSHFFTIEDNGSSLCEYGESWVEKRYYPERQRNGEKLLPYFLNCFTGEDLPPSKDDDTIINSRFIHLKNTLNHGLFIVTKTPKYWHIYNFYERYDEKSKQIKLSIKDMLLFDANKSEVTAFTTTGGDFFIAFKNDAIRKYNIIVPLNVTGKEMPYVREDTDFYINSKRARYADIKSLVIGYAMNIQALYAISGEDMIYRFSLDGIPDYQVKND